METASFVRLFSPTELMGLLQVRNFSSQHSSLSLSLFTFNPQGFEQVTAAQVLAILKFTGFPAGSPVPDALRDYISVRSSLIAGLLS